MRAPDEVVRAYCAAVGLPFLPEALRWAAGDRPEWQRTAALAPLRRPQHRLRHRPAAVRCRSPTTLRDYYDHHRPFYQRLLQHALTLSPTEAPR